MAHNPEGKRFKPLLKTFYVCRFISGLVPVAFQQGYIKTGIPIQPKNQPTASSKMPTVPLNNGFVDLQTFDDLEGWMYGGVAVNPFRRTVTKCTWFSMVCTILNKQGTTATFGGELQASFARSADYILHVWLRCLVPAVPAIPGEIIDVPATASGSTTLTIKPILQPRWSRRLAHNLIESDLGRKRCDATHKKHVVKLFFFVPTKK